MEKLKTLVQYLQKKLGKKTRTESIDSEEEIGRYSMNEGQPDKVFGFRREVVKGIAIFFITVFVLALIFASSGTEEDEEKVETLPIATESEIASAKKPKNELPNDYEALVAMNKAREDELKKQATEQPAEKTKPEPSPIVQENHPVQEIPEIPRNNFPSMPQISQVPELPLEKIETSSVKTETTLQETKGKYKSAISFKLEDETDQNLSESENNSSVQTKMEYSAPNDSTLGVGTIIPVRLLTGINTDVEGQVTAQILTDVYDTATETKLLIPQGSHLMGAYEKKFVSNGRIPIDFTQLVLPNGGCWTIAENLIAIDGAGYAGISGKVNRHTGEKISAGAVGSAIAALGSVAAGNVSTNSNTYTAGQIAAQGAVANLINSTSSLMKEASNIPNTVTVEPGYEFNVYVTNNITFS